MREARVFDHPIHPMLIVFPLGLWIFSLICDLIFLRAGNELWRHMAFYTMLGGLIGAVSAAVPGLMDFLTITEERTRKVGFLHMVLNLTVVALYAWNLYLRYDSASVTPLPLALSVIAVVLLAVSGWLGGDLVYVHKMGVKLEPPQDKEKMQATRTAERPRRQAVR